MSSHNYRFSHFVPLYCVSITFYLFNNCYDMLPDVSGSMPKLELSRKHCAGVHVASDVGLVVPRDSQHPTMLPRTPPVYHTMYMYVISYTIAKFNPFVKICYAWMFLPRARTFPKGLFPQFIPSNPALSPDNFYSCPWGFLTGKTHEKCQTSRYHPIHAKYSCMYNVYLVKY